MILYHGSSIIVDKPLVSKFRESVDFEKNFKKTLLNKKYTRGIRV